MQIILLTDIANLGHKDDVINVKPGYGRNYLIPQGYAILATEAAKKIVAENTKQRAHKEAKLKAEAEELAAKLAELKLTVGAKTSSTGTAGFRFRKQYHDFRSFIGSGIRYRPEENHAERN